MSFSVSLSGNPASVLNELAKIQEAAGKAAQSIAFAQYEENATVSVSLSGYHTATDNSDGSKVRNANFAFNTTVTIPAPRPMREAAKEETVAAAAEAPASDEKDQPAAAAATTT